MINMPQPVKHLFQLTYSRRMALLDACNKGFITRVTHDARVLSWMIRYDYLVVIGTMAGEINGREVTVQKCAPSEYGKQMVYVARHPTLEYAGSWVNSPDELKEKSQ